MYLCTSPVINTRDEAARTSITSQGFNGTTFKIDIRNGTVNTAICSKMETMREPMIYLFENKPISKTDLCMDLQLSMLNN